MESHSSADSMAQHHTAVAAALIDAHKAEADRQTATATRIGGRRVGAASNLEPPEPGDAA